MTNWLLLGNLLLWSSDTRRTYDNAAVFSRKRVCTCPYAQARNNSKPNWSPGCDTRVDVCGSNQLTAYFEPESVEKAFPFQIKVAAGWYATSKSWFVNLFCLWCCSSSSTESIIILLNSRTSLSKCRCEFDPCSPPLKGLISCCCHRIKHNYLCQWCPSPSLYWLSSYSFPWYHTLHYCLSRPLCRGTWPTYLSLWRLSKWYSQFIGRWSSFNVERVGAMSYPGYRHNIGIGPTQNFAVAFHFNCIFMLLISNLRSTYVSCPYVSH